MAFRFHTDAEFPPGCAVVFGGSGGLGRAIAELLALRGTDVVLTYHTREAVAAEVVSAIQGYGRKGSALACELSSSEAVHAVLDSARALHGRVHTIVSAGGMLFDVGPLVDFKPEAYRGVIEADVIGFFNIAQAGIKTLRAGGGGSITALVTPAITSMVQQDALSSVPKAAVAMLVRHIAAEEARNGIRANAVGPGLIDAGINVHVQQDPKMKPLFDAVLSQAPFGRAGRAEELAEVVAFLASAKASYVSGQVIHCDGALSA